MGDVRRLRPKDRSCWDCIHFGLDDNSAGYCWRFREPMDDETTAQECGEFEPEGELP